MDIIIDVEKLDIGSVITEYPNNRSSPRKRGIPGGEELVRHILEVVEKQIRENKRDRFRIVFSIENPPPTAI